MAACNIQQEVRMWTLCTFWMLFHVCTLFVVLDASILYSESAMQKGGGSGSTAVDCAGVPAFLFACLFVAFLCVFERGFG